MCMLAVWMLQIVFYCMLHVCRLWLGLPPCSAVLFLLLTLLPWLSGHLLQRTSHSYTSTVLHCKLPYQKGERHQGVIVQGETLDSFGAP